MNFHVGMKVVCVRSAALVHAGWRWIPNRPVTNGIYTIREILPLAYFGHEREIALLLCELINPVVQWKSGLFEGGFPSKFFRPIKTTDISIFTKMLAPTPKERETA